MFMWKPKQVIHYLSYIAHVIEVEDQTDKKKFQAYFFTSYVSEMEGMPSEVDVRDKNLLGKYNVMWFLWKKCLIVVSKIFA